MSDSTALDLQDDDMDLAPVDAKSAPDDRATAGPFDEAELDSSTSYIDLGGVRIPAREGLQLRLEVEEGTKRVVAVALDYAGSTLQLQAFAAPRTTGLWHEIRRQITEQIEKQGGRTKAIEGAFGPEVLAQIPTVLQGGEGSTRIARFVGVDGPRWFLRGVIAGRGAVDRQAGARVEELFRSVVVSRGGGPMPPRDLIPLRMPERQTPPAAPQGAAPQAAAPQAD